MRIWGSGKFRLEEQMYFVKMDIEQVVASIVESMLHRFSDDKTVLTMSFDLALRRKSGGGKPAIRRKVHLMFHRPNNYTKVLWNVATTGPSSYLSYKVWELKCDHDSCWRSDGVGSPFSRLTQEMMKEIVPEVGFQDVETSVNFYLMDGFPKLVKLQSYKYDREKRTFTVEYAKSVSVTAQVAVQ